jgi:hypothetical protein
MMSLDVIEHRLGHELFDYQRDALTLAQRQGAPWLRLLLYYKTGAGKTLTALLCVAQDGYDEAVVICPPSTYPQWQDAGAKVGVKVECMSHAKFRMKTTKLSRLRPVIADEFHLFGGHTGKGWKKLDTLGRHLQAPLVLASATPNYNDAERVYCIQHVLAPATVKGGYLEWLYQHCNTKQNMFGLTPLLDEDQPFKNYKDAAEFLASLPYTSYVEDDLVYDIQDVPLKFAKPDALARYGYNKRKKRIIASQMEERHALVDLALLDSQGLLRADPFRVISTIIQRHQSKSTLIFAAHSQVANGAYERIHSSNLGMTSIVTGATSGKTKDNRIESFRQGAIKNLIGTASLATGTDGLDKVCDLLIILDDTDDDSLRRQLIGRIMPRGAQPQGAHDKYVYRLVF